MKQQLADALTAEFPDCDVKVERRKGVIYCSVRKFVPAANDTMNVAFAISQEIIAHSRTKRDELTAAYVREARQQLDQALAA